MPDSSWDNLQFDLRLRKAPRQVITTTAKPIPLLKGLVARDGQDVGITRGSTYDNRKNLAPTFFSQIVREYEGPGSDARNLRLSYWRTCREPCGPEISSSKTDASESAFRLMRRIVVALDLAVGIGEDSDETGLLVRQLGVDDRGYVLEDASGKSLNPFVAIPKFEFAQKCRLC